MIGHLRWIKGRTLKICLASFRLRSGGINHPSVPGSGHIETASPEMYCAYIDDLRLPVVFLFPPIISILFFCRNTFISFLFLKPSDPTVARLYCLHLVTSILLSFDTQTTLALIPPHDYCVIMYTKTVYFAAALGLQQAAANWDLNASRYKCPGSTPTTCSPNQQGGWNFGSISSGGFSGFDGFDFSCGAGSGVSGSGWTCNDGFQGLSGHKRSLLPRTGGGKCVEADLQNKPTVSCSDRDFTAATFDLISDFDVDFIMECDQGNGQTCQQSGHCAKAGSSFQNTQCAGCKSISFKGSGGFSGSCGFGIQSIGWDCASSSTTPSIPSATPSSIQTPSSSVQTTPTSIQTPSSSAQATPTITSSPSTPTIITSLSTSTVISTTEITITSCAATVTNCPAGSTTVITSTLTQFTTVCPITLTQVTQTPGGPSSAPVPGSSTSAIAIPSSTLITVPSNTPTSSAQAQVSSTPSAPAPGTTQEVVTTEVLTEYTTICPVTQTVIPSGSSAPIVTTALSTSTVTVTGISTICTQCVAPGPSSTAQGQGSAPVPSGTAPSTPQSSSPAGPGSPCPTVVPSCLNTWLFTTTCKDNTDVGCFCQLANYTSSVIGCISSYGATPDEISQAISYLQGICAPYVSANPGVVTGVPSGISPAPVPSTVPATTITITGASGVTTATVPAVQFTTQTSPAAGATGAPAAPSPYLVPGSASPVPAVSSAAAGVTAPFPTGAPGAPGSPAASGTGVVTGANPASTSPIPFQGAASKGAVSGIVGLGAVVVAVLAL